MDDTVHEFDTQHAVGTEPTETVGVDMFYFSNNAEMGIEQVVIHTITSICWREICFIFPM